MLLQGWELALIIMAVTFMVVNLVNVFVQIKVLSKFDRVFNKSALFTEKMIDLAEKAYVEMLENEEE